MKKSFLCKKGRLYFVQVGQRKMTFGSFHDAYVWLLVRNLG